MTPLARYNDGFDDFGSRDTIAGGDYSDFYTLDLVGNIVQKRRGWDANGNGQYDDGDSSDSITGYTYNQRNQLLSEACGPTTSYTYDADGNQITKTDSTGTTYYTWDLRGRMVTVTTPNGVTTTYGYDSDGQRTSEKTGFTAATFYVNDKNNFTGNPQIVEEKAGSSPTTATLARSYTAGLAVNGQADSNGVVYFLLDGHGSNRGLLSSGGNVAQAMDYTAYGDAVGFDPATVGTIHLFAGDGEFDRISKMYYRDARWGIGGRFISEDGRGYAQISNPVTLNAYLYAGANPIKFQDLNGHMFTELLVVGLTIGILGTLYFSNTLNGAWSEAERIAHAKSPDYQDASEITSGATGSGINCMLWALNVRDFVKPRLQGKQDLLSYPDPSFAVDAGAITQAQADNLLLASDWLGKIRTVGQRPFDPYVLDMTMVYMLKNYSLGRPVPFGTKAGPGFHIVVLIAEPGPITLAPGVEYGVDFHFYTQHKNGQWSAKPGFEAIAEPADPPRPGDPQYVGTYEIFTRPREWLW